MITFEVKDMTCGRCVGAITKAIQQIDANATVQIDLPTKRVAIESATADSLALRAAIAGAGYTSTPVDASAAPVAAPARRGCCCAAAA
jgi:copper chaperone